MSQPALAHGEPARGSIEERIIALEQEADAHYMTESERRWEVCQLVADWIAQNPRRSVVSRQVVEIRHRHPRSSRDRSK